MLENLGSMGLAQGNTFGYSSQDALKQAQAQTQAKNAEEPSFGLGDALGGAANIATSFGPFSAARKVISGLDSKYKQEIGQGGEALRNMGAGHFDTLAEQALGPNATPNGSMSQYAAPAANAAQTQTTTQPTEPEPESPARQFLGNNPAQRQPQTNQSLYGNLQKRLGGINSQGALSMEQKIGEASKAAELANTMDKVNNREPIQDMFKNVASQLGMGGNYGDLIGSLVARKMDKNANQKEMSAVDKVRANAQAQLQGTRESAMKEFDAQREAFAADRQYGLEQQKQEQAKAIEEMKANRNPEASLKYLEGDPLSGSGPTVFNPATGQTYGADEINQYGSVQRADQAKGSGMTADEYKTAMNMIKSGQATPEQFKEQYGFLPT